MPNLNAMNWNYADNLKEVDLGGGGIAYYVYDSSGERVRKVIENGTTTKDRIYSGDYGGGSNIQIKKIWMFKSFSVQEH